MHRWIPLREAKRHHDLVARDVVVEVGWVPQVRLFWLTWELRCFWLSTFCVLSCRVIWGALLSQVSVQQQDANLGHPAEDRAPEFSW